MVPEEQLILSGTMDACERSSTEGGGTMHA